MHPIGRWGLLGLAVVCGVLLMKTGAHAQNNYSFTDASRSALDYRQAPVAARMSCQDLKNFADAKFTVVSAELIAAAGDVPEFCRVVGLMPPDNRFEVALPTHWNGRLYLRGNGGMAGEAIDAPPRVAQRNAALRASFVAAQTNTGHDAAKEPLATFAVNLEKLADYAFRAIHETAQAEKRLARAYYDHAASFAYFDGCSTGGRQGLMSAQRYPADFDGIVVGAPVLNFADTMLWGVWNAKALAAAPISYDAIAAVGKAVYDKCDAADGLADGLIRDPRKCAFDPGTDLPKCPAGREEPGCFTSGQIATLKAIYGGMVVNGKPYFFGLPVGVEKAGARFTTAPGKVTGWDFWLLNPAGPNTQTQLVFAESGLRYMGAPKPDPSYDWRSSDFEKDHARLANVRRDIDAMNPDLSAFKAHGGKIVMYHGWSDAALTPYMSVDYHERVTAKMGAQTPDFLRLYMVPGMFHCRGGLGPDHFDALTPLVNWVERGTAPEQLIATQWEEGKPGRTRPLCPHPQAAQYKGSGSPDDAANFVCAVP